MRLISLFIVLFVTWLLMSGHYETLIIVFGLGSCLAAVLVGRRMDIVDHEGHPLQLSWKIPFYWIWLAVQIVKSNIDVAWRCILPGNRIDPCVVMASATQKTSVGVVTYANSITLTPGTIAMRTWEHEIEVHALTGSAADDVLKGDMDGRVDGIEGHYE